MTPDPELSDAEAAVLDVLQEGRATTGYIIEQTDYSDPHIQTQLKILLAKNYIQRVHKPTALYELVNDPRTTDAEAKPASVEEDSPNFRET